MASLPARGNISRNESPYAPYSQELIGTYDIYPIKHMGEEGTEVDASEGEVLKLPEGTAESIAAATWGAGAANIDVTAALIGALKEGGLEVLATNDALGLVAGEDPAPGMKKRLIVRYIPSFYTSPEGRLASEGVDIASLLEETPDGGWEQRCQQVVQQNQPDRMDVLAQLQNMPKYRSSPQLLYSALENVFVGNQLHEAQIKNERLIHENKQLGEQVTRYTRWDHHYREVEDRLREELAKRRQLEQAVYENEGAHVATRLRELEREVTRLRNSLRREQDMVLDEQRQRQLLQEEVQSIKDTKGAAAGNVLQQVSLLREENARVASQLQEVNRLNTQLQLSIREEADYDKLRADIFAKDNVDPATGRIPMSTTHVQVRKSVLCAKCKGAVELWERQALSRQMSAATYRYGSETDRDLYSHGASAASPQPPTPLSPDAFRLYGSPLDSVNRNRDLIDPATFPTQGPGYSGRGVTKI